MEHRWGNRIETDQPVRLRTRGGFNALGRLRNVSISGGFVQTIMPLRTDSLLEIELLASSTRDDILTAVIVRRVHDGIGIEWSELGAPAIQRLLIEPQAAGREPVPWTRQRQGHR